MGAAWRWGRRARRAGPEPQEGSPLSHPLANYCLPASHSPCSCSSSSLPAPPPAENFPLTPPLFHGRPNPQPRASRLPVSSWAVRRRGPRAARRPERLLGGSRLRAGWTEVGSRRANSVHRLRAPRGRAPRPRGPCPRHPESLRGAGGGPGARLPTPQAPQTPASAAGRPAFWPPPRRARPRSAVLTVGALSGPGLGGRPAPGTLSPSPPRAAPDCAPRRPERQRRL